MVESENKIIIPEGLAEGNFYEISGKNIKKGKGHRNYDVAMFVTAEDHSQRPNLGYPEEEDPASGQWLAFAHVDFSSGIERVRVPVEDCHVTYDQVRANGVYYTDIDEHKKHTPLVTEFLSKMGSLLEQKAESMPVKSSEFQDRFNKFQDNAKKIGEYESKIVECRDENYKMAFSFKDFGDKNSHAFLLRAFLKESEDK